MSSSDDAHHWTDQVRAAIGRADELRLLDALARSDDEPAAPRSVRGLALLAECGRAIWVDHAIGTGAAPNDAPRLELRRAGLPLATLTLVHGRVLHWPQGAPAFVRLAEQSATQLCAWLSVQGFALPQEELWHVRKRERLWDTVVTRQAAQLPDGAPESLWEPGNDAERQAALVTLVPDPELRASVCLKVLGASHVEWFVGLPLDRLIESYLHDGFSADTIAAALHRVWLDPVGLAGAVRWLVHAGGAEHLPPLEGARIMPGALRYALMHPVPRNRTEALEMLDRITAGFVTPLLQEVFEGRIEVDTLPAADEELLHVFSDPGTFYVDDTVVRDTSDQAYAALLLARRGETGIRERVRQLMDTANEADFHALALAMEALDELD